MEISVLNRLLQSREMRMTHNFTSSILLLLLLLNPFLLIIYLIDLVQDLDAGEFRRILVRAGLISSSVFTIFALLGDMIFEDLLQARFASFQIFGGLIFLLIGIQFVFTGPGALRSIRGAPEHVAGSIAMPIMIGPGTVSASILAGSKLPPLLATGGDIRRSWPDRSGDDLLEEAARLRQTAQRKADRTLRRGHGEDHRPGGRYVFN